MEIICRSGGNTEREMGRGPTLELELLRRNFCLYGSESKTAQAKKRALNATRLV